MRVGGDEGWCWSKLHEECSAWMEVHGGAWRCMEVVLVIIGGG